MIDREKNYGFLSRALHRLALGSRAIAQSSFDMEKVFYPRTPVDESRHVFITGLARAGTTILLRSLHDTGSFRSLTYRNMPFVLMPTGWPQLSRGFWKQMEPTERAHGDRIEVDFNSPEAFEEVFWRVFCAEEYILPNRLVPHRPEDEIVDSFRQFVGQILSGLDSASIRYLSKNNNNILRLGTLIRAFSDCVIVIVIRDPLQQAHSLMRQHEKFCARHDADRFSQDYMRWLGHHEFGRTHKRFDFGRTESKESYDIADINYWIALWCDVYRHVDQNAPEDSIIVPYETFCAEPKRVLSEILLRAGLSAAADSKPPKMSPAATRPTRGIEPALERLALHLYERLKTRSPFN